MDDADLVRREVWRHMARAYDEGATLIQQVDPHAADLMRACADRFGSLARRRGGPRRTQGPPGPHPPGSRPGRTPDFLPEDWQAA